MTAESLATALCAEFEGFCPYPYPDPASDLACASRGCRWGHEPATIILAGLPLAVRLLSGNPWTQGFGQTGKAIGPNNPAWSLNVARANLEGVVEECCEAIRARCSSLLPEQVAALASFLENVGGGRAGVKDGLFELKSGGPSTLWHCVITGQHQRAADQFLLWTRAQGRVLPGLVKRRRAERALYLRAA